MTVATLIHEYQAPVQPADCKRVNLERLAAALKASGPVVHNGVVVSLAADGTIDFESRPHDKIPAVTTTDDEGHEHTTPERDPTDAELAKAWGVKAAADVPLEIQTTNTPAPNPHPET